MRTTVTLDPDTKALLDKRMHEHGVSFKRAINDAVRAGLTDRGARPPFRTPTFAMGPPKVNLDKALQLSGRLEDEERLRKMRAGLE